VGNNWSMVSPDILAIMGVIDTRMQWSRKNSSRPYFQYHPSEFGQCLRKAQYRRYAALGYIDIPEEEINSQTLRLFEKGHNMQRRWSSYFEDAGILRGYWKCKHCWSNANGAYKILHGKQDKIGVFKPAKCDCGCTAFQYEEIAAYDEELNMSGHVDMVIDFSQFDPSVFNGIKPLYNIANLPQKPIVVDMKTSNNMGFGKTLRDGPSFAYQVQLTIYANILGYEYGLLIYENKDNSRTASFKIPKNTDTIFASIKQQVRLMNEMVANKQLPPPRPNKKDSYECNYCPCSSMCKSSGIWKHEKLSEMRKKFYGMLL